MSTTVLKKLPGRTELWARGDEYDFLLEALGRSGLPYDEINDPFTDARGYAVTEPGIDATMVRHALDATGVTLPWVPDPAPAATGSSELRAGQYGVKLMKIAGDADRVAVAFRDGEGNVVDPKRATTLDRNARPMDVAAALPPDALYAPNQLHDILEAVRNMPRTR